MVTMPSIIYAPRPTPQDRTSFVPISGDSRAARAIGALGQQVGQFSDELERRADIAAVSEARQKLDEWERASIFDPERGAVNRRGADAAGVPEELQKGFDELAGEISSGLRGQRQQEAFAQVVAGRRGQVLDWATKHALRERESYEEGQYQADVKAFQDRAALFPDKAGPELSMMSQRIIGHLRDRGRSTEEIGAVLREQSDKAHVGVVASLLNSDDEAAAIKYFEANKGRMSADVQARVGNEIKQRGNLLAAQRNADELVKSGVSEKEALEKTRAAFQGRGEEAAVQELRTRYAEAETARIRRVKEVSNSAWASVMAGGSMTAIPAQVMAELRATAPEEERQMRDWLEAKAERAKRDAKGESQTTDWPTYLRLRDSALSNPEQFLQEDLGKYAPYIAGPQLEQLQDMKDRLGNPKAAKDMIGVQKRIMTAVRELKLAGTGQAVQEKRGKLESAITDAVDAAQEAKGKTPLTPKEVQAEIDRVLISGQVESGAWWKPNQSGRLYEFAGDPEKRARFKPEIPDADRARLVQTFQKRGVAKPTEEQIMSAYKAMRGL